MQRCGRSGDLYGQWCDRGTGRCQAGDRESTGGEDETVLIEIFADGVVGEF